MLLIEDRHDDCDKEDKMNIAEVKEMECRRRQRRLRSAMLPTFDVEQGSFIPYQVPKQNGGKNGGKQITDQTQMKRLPSEYNICHT